MSDFGALSGALMLSNQISTNRLLDSLWETREANKLALNNAAWRNKYNNLLNNYNWLVNDANQVTGDMDRTIATQAASIARLEGQVAELLARLEKLQLEHDYARSEARMLRSMNRELDPEAYR